MDHFEGATSATERAKQTTFFSVQHDTGVILSNLVILACVLHVSACTKPILWHVNLKSLQKNMISIY